MVCCESSDEGQLNVALFSATPEGDRSKCKKEWEDFKRACMEKKYVNEGLVRTEFKIEHLWPDSLLHLGRLWRSQGKDQPYFKRMLLLLAS